MSKINSVIFCLIAFLLLPNAKGTCNGGPMDGSAVYKNGNIVLINYPHILLKKESLKIRVEGDYSYVNVQYHLQNYNEYSEDITYGFPIDFIVSADDFSWRKEYLPEITFKLDGKTLPVKHQVDLSIFQEDRGIFLEGHNFDNVKRSWHIVDFKIEKNATVLLTVDYKIKNGFEDWETSKSFFPSFDQRIMAYDFSPASYWGTESVDLLDLSIDVSSILKNGGTVDIKGVDLTHSSNITKETTPGIYFVQLSEFNLREAKNLLIVYNNSDEKISSYLRSHQIPVKKIKNTKTSSQLEGNYSGRNLFDMDFTTAWAEGKQDAGIGEKIEIELDTINQFQVLAICMVNGYTKNSQTYLENNRVKKVRVEEIFNNTTYIERKEVDLEDLPYQDIRLIDFIKMTSVIGNHGVGQPGRKITITILEVYPGTKYDDTCISELILAGYDYN